VEGAVVMEQPRLVQVDGIHCEAPLGGNVIFLRNQDIPGVIGYVGEVLGKNGLNIATFSLGRKQAGDEAIAVIQTDQPVTEGVLAELLQNPALTVARPVKFTSD
jgi:D-3-phosphoglycerate dehydrogenase